MKNYDMVIIGAGIYGLYLANIEEFKAKKKLIIEIDDDSFKRASFINQARLHNGYHYPLSLETAKDAHEHFKQFYKEFSFAVNNSFKSIYAVAQEGSASTAKEFEAFCDKVGIPLEKINPSDFFKDGMVEAAYVTEEYTFDANKIKDYLISSLKEKNTDIIYSTYIKDVKINGDLYKLHLSNSEDILTSVVINTAYASINCVNKLFNMPLMDMKYEICEIALGKANKALQNHSFTVMNGKFFSLMPFPDGKNYSLTSVYHTPHVTSYNNLPVFDCQLKNDKCSKNQLYNCNDCKFKPITNQQQMQDLCNSFLLDKYKFTYENSLFTIKPKLISSELDAARPTLVMMHRTHPTYISCMSGKINTIYIMKENILKSSKHW